MSSSTRTILVVDDDAAVRESLDALLDAEGHSVRTAADARAALAAIEAAPPALLISDIYMGPTDGLELMAAIRRRGMTFPIIALSGADDKYNVLKVALKLGAAAAFSKPFHPDELLASIQRILSDSQGDSGKR